MSAPSVFISYSHKDEIWKDRLVTHLGVLEQEGILDLWDDRRIEGGDDWKPEIEKAINKATVAILMISANFLTSQFILGEEVPKLLKRREKEGVRVIPLIVKPCAWTQVKWLSPIQARPKDGKPLSTRRTPQADADLATFANEIAAIVKRVGVGATHASPLHAMPIPPDKISLAKLPSTDSTLFGRDDRLRELDKAWENQQINVVSLVAWGGVGKSALVNKWLSQMVRDNYRGAQRVYGWSFYSQGAAEGRQVSADPFIAAALVWFGDPEMAESSASAWDKGERLAELIREQRTLLILDGLEPLQNPPPVETGKIKDPGLTSLLRELAQQNPGLVVISTRLTVDDLKDFKGSTAMEIDLESLSPKAGAAYLAHLGVDGTDEEQKQASCDFGGHALALTLLGRYLVDEFDGDIRKRDFIPHLTEEEEKGGHAKRIMQAYEKWFEEKPERDLLYIMGLFDRPAQKGALDALLAVPIIDGLTNKLQGLPAGKYKLVLKHLRQARLLAEQDPHDPETLDCHPLLREHFGEKLKAENLKAWSEAHGRLYEYYKASAKELPDTMEEMAPLFAAVLHGCQAGQHQEVLNEVFWKRIRRESERFSTSKLGVMGADLAALSGFFDGTTWRKPVDGLSEADKGFVLNAAGFDLRALGRLAEATQPMQTALEGEVAQERWNRAAAAANNISELYLAIGDVTQALAYAGQSVQLVDRGGDAFRQMGNRTTLANALHQAGHLAESEISFHEADEMQRKYKPEFPLLYTIYGFRYCDLLLDKGEYREVIKRATQTLEWVSQYTGELLGIAQDHLSLGRALTLTLPSPNGRGVGGEGEKALTHLNRAVDGLRQAGQQDELPRGLLARAEFYRVTGVFDKARKDLDAAFSIATRSGMGLHLADCHLEYARLALAQPLPNPPLKGEGRVGSAREHLKIAKEMIAKMGYHRRDREVEELEKQLKGACHSLVLLPLPNKT